MRMATIINALKEKGIILKRHGLSNATRFKKV